MVVAKVEWSLEYLMIVEVEVLSKARMPEWLTGQTQVLMEQSAWVRIPLLAGFYYFKNTNIILTFCAHKY